MVSTIKRKWALIFLVCVDVLGVFCPQRLPAQEEAGFPDVPKNHRAYQAVTDLKQRGILIGYPAGSAIREESHPTIVAAHARRSSASSRGPKRRLHPARRKAERRR